MSVGSFFKGIVPYLSAAAEAFGGPAGAIAASVLTKVTGSTVKPPDIAQTISNLATSEQGRIQLDAAEKEYSETMAKLGYQDKEAFIAALNADRDSARQREEKVQDKTPRNLAYLTVCVAGLLVYLTLSGKSNAFHDPAEAATVGTVIGFVFRDLAHVYSYYFGGDGSSEAPTKQ